MHFHAPSQILRSSFSATWRVLRLVLSLAAVGLLVACAHPISIEASALPERGAQQSSKKAAYIITAADKQKQVTTPGGGSDKVSYYPYRDFERSLRAALASAYADVSVVPSLTDAQAIRDSGASFIFVPEISTTSSSSSAVTWPPTMFNIIVTVNVFNGQAAPVAQLRVSGTGNAEWAEFKGDFGIAGRRAVEQAAVALAQEIRSSEKLR
jgi:hypothetical protein